MPRQGRYLGEAHLIDTDVQALIHNTTFENEKETRTDLIRRRHLVRQRIEKPSAKKSGE